MMKKMFLYILIIISLIIIGFLINQSINAKEKKEKKELLEQKLKVLSESKYLLKNIDFSDADYALYIRDKKQGTFMVLDEQALIDNKNKLKVKSSWLNYLPGEGDRNFGVILFKNKKRIKSALGAIFTDFEIGNLKDFGIPVEQKNFWGTKSEMQQKLDSLKNDKNAFITYQPDFVKDNRAYSFRIYFPSIAVPVTRGVDSLGYARIFTVNGIDYNTWTMKKETEFDKKWTKTLEECIRKKAGSITDFEISVSKSSLSNAYLFDTTKKWGDLTSADKKLLYINDFMFFNFDAFIMTNKENAEKLLTLDYSDCLSEEERNKPQVIAKMKALVKQSNSPNLDVDKGEVGLSDYIDQTSKYKATYEQEYQISWLELNRKTP